MCVLLSSLPLEFYFLLTTFLSVLAFGLDGIKIAKAKISEDKVEAKINVEEQELELEMYIFRSPTLFPFSPLVC